MKLTFGQKLADNVTATIGSWKFIFFQTIFVIIWLTVNTIAFLYHWDVYPFILLNLIFSTQAAYTAPMIMMSQNRQSQRDREQIDAILKLNLQAKEEMKKLNKILEKLGKQDS